MNRLFPNYSGTALLHNAFCAAIPYIIITMNNGKSLLKSNKYLRNGAVREAMIVRHASSSTRIEGVKLAIERAKRLARASRAPR
jgi:ribosomal protein L14